MQISIAKMAKKKKGGACKTKIIRRSKGAAGDQGSVRDLAGRRGGGGGGGGGGVGDTANERRTLFISVAIGGGLLRGRQYYRAVWWAKRAITWGRRCIGSSDCCVKV